jgi:hypothetical protein
VAIGEAGWGKGSKGTWKWGSERLCMEKTVAGKQKGKESSKVNAEAGDCDYEWPG